MLLRVTIQPTEQSAYTLEFFDPDLARDMMRLIASGSVAMAPTPATAATSHRNHLQPKTPRSPPCP